MRDTTFFLIRIYILNHFILMYGSRATPTINYIQNRFTLFHTQTHTNERTDVCNFRPLNTTNTMLIHLFAILIHLLMSMLLLRVALF